MIWRFNFAVNRALITYREPILDMQLVQERIANAAMDLFASTCVLSRIDGEIQFAGEMAIQNRRTTPLQICFCVNRSVAFVVSSPGLLITTMKQ